MPRPLPQERWLAEAASRFAALDAWRQTHPHATWTEIEAAVDGQLGPLRARMLGETAMASAAADLGGTRPACPDCGARLQAAGPHRRHLRGEQDMPIVLERTYARCPQCGAGLFPPGCGVGLAAGSADPDAAGAPEPARGAPELRRGGE